MPPLELVGVTLSFAPGFIPRPRVVLNDISFAVEAGEAFGFLGSNGAGKTTTIKLIVGLLFPDSGSVRIDGIPSHEPRARRSLGYLPENPYFYDYLTGAEFLDFYGRLSGLDAATRRRRSRELLERLALGDAGKLAIRHYSKGMVQRLGLAQALIGEPRLLVLDEPMSGLDPIGRREVRDLILETRGRGSTVFFSSHILQDAEMICDRVAILADGRIRSIGRLEALLAGAGSGYEVGLAGDAAAAIGCERVVARSENNLLVRVSTLEEAERLVAAARLEGARLVSLQPVRVTLEDLFLREVGASARGGAR